MTNIPLHGSTTHEANAMTLALPARSEPRVEVATNLLAARTRSSSGTARTRRVVRSR